MMIDDDDSWVNWMVLETSFVEFKATVRTYLRTLTPDIIQTCQYKSKFDRIMSHLLKVTTYYLSVYEGISRRANSKLQAKYVIWSSWLVVFWTVLSKTTTERPNWSLPGLYIFPKVEGNEKDDLNVFRTYQWLDISPAASFPFTTLTCLRFLAKSLRPAYILLYFIRSTLASPL